ncbi:MAG: hypothetical protein DID90_2727552520 [Candidatus Nitrotoga sp. LAW]|nr:MAG: hypothetical protein DID90_2727552520 [Candidatus Nitrotoga sp. LAW]
MFYGKKNQTLQFCKYEPAYQLQEGLILAVVCALLATPAAAGHQFPNKSSFARSLRAPPV